MIASPRRRRVRLVHATICALSLALSAPAVAEADGPPSRADATRGDQRRLADIAPIVVTGVVGSDVRTVPAATGIGHVDSLVPVSVSRRSKGDVQDASIVVRQPGGKLPDGGQLLVSESPDLQPGEHVTLFLTPLPGANAFEVVMGHLGVIREFKQGHEGAAPERNPLFTRDPGSVTVDDACADQDDLSGVGWGYSGFQPKHVRWRDNVYAVNYNTNLGTGNVPAITHAASLWNTAGGLGQVVVGQATVDSPNNLDDRRSTIGFGTVSKPTALGTAYTQLSADGFISQVDIALRQSASWSTGTNNPANNEYDIVGVIAHEYGHALGLAHVLDEGQQMYPCSQPPGVWDKALEWGDQYGHLNLYPPNTDGYWLLDESGAVFGLGGWGSKNLVNAAYHGGANGNNVLNYPTFKATDIEARMPTRDGYYILGDNGGVFAYDAPFHGSAATDKCGACGSAIDLAVTPTGNWYTVLTSTGHTYAYPTGTSNYGGVTTWLTGGRYATGIATRPTAEPGWWVVNNLGEVYAMPLGGSTPYVGGGIPSWAQPAVSISPTTSGNGYWIYSAAGDAFAFGDAVDYYLPVNLGGKKLSRHPTKNSIASVASSGYTAIGGTTTNYGVGTTSLPYVGIAATQRVVAPSLTMVAPATVTVRRGSTGSGTITLSSNDTFFSHVSFSTSGVPSGVSASVSPNPLLVPASSQRTATLNVSVPATYLGTNFGFTVHACGQGICRSSSVAVVVTV